MRTIVWWLSTESELRATQNWFECLYLFIHLTFDIIHYLWWLLFGSAFQALTRTSQPFASTNPIVECRAESFVKKWNDYGKWLFVLIPNSLFIYQPIFFPPRRHALATAFSCFPFSINVEHNNIKVFSTQSEPDDFRKWK